MVIGDTHAEHLINTLKKNYDVTIDREGKIFCGIHLKWNYEGKRNVRLSVPKYVDKAQAILSHEAPKKPQHSPHPYSAPQYGKHIQYAKLTSNDNQLTHKQLHYCQTFCGLFNYYSQSIDSTMKQPLFLFSPHFIFPESLERHSKFKTPIVYHYCPLSLKFSKRFSCTNTTVM